MEKNPFFEYLSTTLLHSYHLSFETAPEKVEYPKWFEKEDFAAVNFDDFEKTKGKNVILVILESTAFERTPLGGDKESKLSFLNELSTKSLNFISHRTIFPATTRSVFALFCSNIPGTDYFSITESDFYYDCNSLTDVFKKNGYKTSFFSPVTLEFDDFENSSIVKDFDYVFEPSEIIATNQFNKKFGTETAIEEEIVQDKFFEHIKELKKNNQPFFTFYFPYWTHAPYEVPFSGSFGLNTIERYRKSQAYINEKMIEFFSRLEKENILENSIVIVTSDHGEAMGRKVGNYIHPNYLFDENLHIPFLIYAKNITDAKPMTISNPTTILDVAPTLAELIGIKPDSSWLGKNMFGDFSYFPVFIYTRAMKLHNGILDGNHKFFYNLLTGENYYFNLKTDPFENNNLADEINDNDLILLKKFIEYKNFELNKR